MAIYASIIILCYNQAKTVGRAIESVLRQNSPYPYEIIIADDDSHDGTREIAEEFASRYPDKIRLVPRHPNMGLVRNYFNALSFCKGKYIGDCAGDDEWIDPMRLARQIAALESDSGISVVFTDVEEVQVNADGELTRNRHSSMPRRSRWMRPRVAGEEILIGTLNHTTELPFTLSAALYRKSVIEKALATSPEIILMEEMGVEDVPILAALGAAGDAAWLPIVGLRYYIDGESVSNNLAYEKEYQFTSKVTRGGAKLADFYKIPKSKVRDHYRVKINHMAAQIRHARRPDLIPELMTTVNSYWHTSLPLRARLHLLILRLTHP